jgi:protein-disulfide isomerase
MHSPFASTLGLALQLTLCALAVAAPSEAPLDPVANAASGTAAVARIGNQVITEAQLQAGTHDQLAQQQREHERQLRQIELSFQRSRHAYLEEQLETMVDQRVLELEAAARKTSTDALLAGALKPAPITDAAVQSFYESRQPPIEQPLAQIAPRIRQFLTDQADAHARRGYLDGLRAKYHAVLELAPMREPVEPSGPARGPADAAVTIVEFSDFQCPYCGRFTPVLKQLMAAYPTQVRLVFRYFPIASLHPQAQKAAEAAACADRQGKFWPMHDTLFAEQGALDLDALKDKAARIGLDTAQFATCLDSGAAAPTVAADIAAGQNLGIDATPGSFVNGRFVNGAVTIEELTRLVKDELRRKASSGTF